MTEEMKLELFKKVQWIEHMEDKQQDGMIFGASNAWDWHCEAECAFKMLEIEGLDQEYIRWAVGE